MRYRGTVIAVMVLASACGGDDSDDADGPAGAEESSESSQESTAEDPAIYPTDTWQSTDPTELGFDPDELDALAEESRQGGTDCLLVARNGQIAAEWYWNDTDDTTTHEAFSATKSYTSALVGIARDDGVLDIESRAADYITEWAGTPSEDITIRNLLSGDTGLHAPDDFGVTSEEDATAFGIALEQDEPPGTTWANNEPAIQTLQTVLSQTTGEEPATYAQERLFDPIGAQDTAMGHDPSGNTFMFWNLQTTCRDAARFGHLYLNDGNWDGTQVVPEEWVRASTEPSQELNPGYGYLWWLNDPDGGDDPGQLAAGATDAPDGMYWALGAFGQIIQVDPDSETVVVRFGDSDALYDISAIEWTTRIVTDALDE